MRPRLWAIGLLTHAGLAGAATEKDHIADIIAKGLQNSFSVRQQNLSEEKAANLKTNSYFSLLPTMALSATRGLTRATTASTDGLSTANTDSKSLSITSTWTLWNGYQNITTVKTAAKELEVQQASTRRTIQTYILQLLSSYLKLQNDLNNQETIKLQLEQTKSTSAETKALVDAGAKTSLEAIDSEIDVENSSRNLIELENTIRADMRELRLLLNNPQLEELPKIDLLKFEPYYMVDFEDRVKRYRKNWREELYLNQPDLVVSKLQLEESAYNLTQTRLGYIPTTSLTLTHTLDMSNMVGQTVYSPAGLNSTAITFNLSWTFWDWFNTPRTISNAEKDYQSSVLGLQQTRMQSETVVQNLLETYDVNLAAIETTRLSLAKAMKQLEYSNEMYRLGRITLLLMQQSVSRVYSARLELANRLATKYLNAANILYNAGYDLQPPHVRVTQ